MPDCSHEYSRMYSLDIACEQYNGKILRSQRHELIFLINCLVSNVYQRDVQR